MTGSRAEGFGPVIVGFLLVWLGTWTFGGIVAFSNFLGLLYRPQTNEYRALQ